MKCVGAVVLVSYDEVKTLWDFTWSITLGDQKAWRKRM